MSNLEKVQCEVPFRPSLKPCGLEAIKIGANKYGSRKKGFPKLASMLKPFLKLFLSVPYP